MSEDDKPFLCGQHGCGMRFTNEDHLCVHMRKHDMSLALNLCETPGGLSPIGFLTDQTPTPTKFLRNCEEMGLFQELSKNPFDDSFKNAMSSSAESTQLLHGNDCQDLDTPQPPRPRIIVRDEEIMENGKPIDKPVDKTKDMTISSILPKKRKKFLTQLVPMSTTSDDDDEEPLIATSDSASLEHNTTLLEEEIKLEPDTVCVIDNCVDTGIVVNEEPVQNVQPKFTAKPIINSKKKPAGIVLSYEGNNFEPVGSSGNDIMTGSKSSQSQSPLMMPLLLKLSNGQMIQIQVPVSTTGINSPSTKTNNLQNVTFLPQNIPQALFSGSQQVYQNVQQVPSQTLSFIDQPFTVTSPVQGTNPSEQAGTGTILNPSTSGQQTASQTVLMPIKQPAILQSMLISPSSTPQIMLNQVPVSQTTGMYSEKPSSGSQSYTKQRLKAALQQQSASVQNQKVNQLFKMMTNMKSEPLWSPGPLEGASVVSSSSSTNSPEGYLNQLEQSTLQEMIPDSADDVEARRMKFLERNRAAAARCRQKRKRFIQTLEEKTENLSTVNSKLCGELKKLRGEIAHLKTLLLAHKDCPVTIMQQRSQVNLDETNMDFEKDNNIQTVPEVTLEEDNQQSSVVTVNHSNFQNVPFSFNLLQGFKVDNLPSEMTSLGVITGPNTISMLPKFFNFDPVVPTTSNS